MATNFVATLVSGAGTELSLEFLGKAEMMLCEQGAAATRVAVLVQDKAADVFFLFEEQIRDVAGGVPPPLAAGGRGGLANIGTAFNSPPSIPPSIPPASGREALTASLYLFFKQLIGNHPIDCIIQPVARRRKHLLLADMESTIIEQEMLDELADTIGLRDKVAAITKRAMNNEIDFAAALKERVGLLRGLPVSVLDDVAKRISLMPGAEELITTIRANGTTAWMVSGGFTYFVKPIAERLQFDRAYANELILRHGSIAGEVLEPVLDKNSKKELLHYAAKELDIALSDSMSVGDGANDIPMLSACNEAGGLGVAYHAKPNVRAVVPHQINHSDLRTLLYVQGYST